MAKIIERVFVFLLATFVAFAGVIFALTGGEGDFVLILILWLLDGLAVWAVLKNPKEKSDDPCQSSPEARLQLKKPRGRFATMIGVALLLLLLFVVFATALPSMSFR